MRISTNDKLIATRAKWARYATFAGLAFLLGSLVTSFTNEQYIVWAYAALFFGFMTSLVGANLANKWVKVPRADQVLEKSLKGFDQKHHLFNFLLPVEHVLLTPTGILAFKVIALDGKITHKNGKWSHPWKWTRVFGGMGQEPLGNPTAELNQDLAAIKKLLADKLANAALVPVDGYVIFSNARAELNLDGANLPVLRAEQLKDALRKSKRAAALPAELYENVDRTLTEIADEKTAK